LIAWATPKLNLLGVEKKTLVPIDTLQLKSLEKMGFRVRVLSPEKGALDVALPEEAAKGKASDLLKALQPVKNQIYWLSLAGTGIQDADLVLIAQFSNLQRLRIENNPITDSGVSALKGLSQLEVLNLNGTKVSGVGLESVSEIKSLKALYLWNTSINPLDERIQKLVANKVKVTIGS
jgi:Leucine-rich repeat (LRR) protein